MFDYLSQFERKKIFRIVGRRFSEGLLIALSPIASAATITVTSLDASSTATNGQVSLAEAIQAANGDISVDGSVAGSGSDTIVFHSSLAGQTIRWSAAAALSVTSNITIDGDINGDGVPDIILSGDVNNNGTRDASESSGLQSDSGGALTVRNLDFRHFVGNSSAGAIRANSGSITIEDSIFRNNAGAAINSSATVGSTVVVRNTLIHDNDASIIGNTGMSSLVRLGGSNNHIVENLVLVNNTGSYSAASTVSSGGIIIVGNAMGSVTITNSTIANNAFINSGGGTISAGGIGWALSGNSGAFTFQNNIVIGNTVNGSSANFSAATGYTNTTNLIDTSVNFVNTATLDYRLASTAANAINQGTLAGSPSTDIRGFNRPRGGGVDIGAYEVLYSAAPVVDLDTGTGGNNSSVNFSGSAVALMPNIDISQSDGDTQLSGVTLGLSGVLDAGNETLSLTAGQITTAAGYGIAVNGSGTTSMTLSGVSTLANYETILALVQYNNTSGSYSSGTRSIAVIVDDDVASISRTASVVLASADVAPSFQNSTPFLSDINSTGATLTVRLDEAGTAFFVVVADGAAAPSSAQVVAGQNNSGAAALASGSINVASAGVDYTGVISGLASSTNYDVYVVARDTALNVQASPALVNLLTEAAVLTVPLDTTFFGTTNDYSATSAAGAAGFTVPNIVGSGWDFTVFSTNDDVDAVINVEVFTGETHLAYGGSMGGDTAITAIRLKPHTYKYFDLKSVDVIIDQANGTSDDTEMPVQLVGYKNGNPVAGAVLIQDVMNATGGGLLVTFDVSANPAFVGIDSFRVETTGSDVTYAIGVDNIVAENFRDATLADSPVLIFTANSADITGDDVASDGEGGSVVITDIDIDIFNISDTDGTPTGLLAWKANSFYTSDDGAYSALTYDDNGGSKGMAIKSADGSEFKLEQFLYYNWGESDPTPATISVVGYRDNAQVALTTFDAYNEDNTPITITLDNSFGNVDEVRLFISAGGYAGDQSVSNHSINNIQVSPAEPNASPSLINLANDSVTWAGVGNMVSLDSGGNADLGDDDFEALNGGNGNWSGATLTVQRNGTAVTADTFGFNTSGALFTVSGGNLQSGGLTFATFTNTNGVLTISFTSSGTAATTALVNDVAQRITYRNDTPAGDATIRFTLSDGIANTTADVNVTSDTIYVTNTSDVGSVDPSNGVGLREALIIAVSNATNVQHIIFDGALASQTITLGGAMTVYQTVSIDADAASGLTIAGGSIDLNPGTTVTLINGVADSLTISSAISESGLLVKSGAGTLTLSGSNDYSGTTTVAAGTLSIGSDSHLGAGALTLGAGSALQVTGATTIDNAINLSGSATLSNNNAVTLSGALSGGAVTLTKTGTGTLTLSNTGNEAGFTGSTTVTAGTLSISNDDHLPAGTLTLDGGTLNLASAVSTIDNAITIGNSNGTISVTNGAATISGAIGGSGALSKTGAPQLTLSGTNTFSGGLSMAGTNGLSITDGTNLGTGTFTMNSGTFTVTGSDITLANAIVLNNSGATISNANTLTLSGAISGTGAITKVSAGSLYLNTANSFSGGLNVNAGMVAAFNTTAAMGTGLITLASGSQLGFASITGGTVSNNIQLDGNATILNGNANNTTTTFTGVISESGGSRNLTLNAGLGTNSSLTLAATNTYSGATTVSNGKVLISGSIGSATTVASGATLAGGGTINGAVTVQSGGTLSPGASPGTLTINGDLTMNAGSTLAVEINGTTAGTGYDQIIVTGTVNVTGATLSATHGYVPGNGDSYTIISNDLADAITGTFSGLPESSSFNAAGNGTVLTTSYVGGTGNDFTLTAPSNDAPMVADLDGDAVIFTQGGSTVRLDEDMDATVTDGDSPDFDGGNVTVSVVANAVAGEDSLGIFNQGTGVGEIGLSGSNVTYGGTTIGSYIGGDSGVDLVISLNGNATPAAVQALVRNLIYGNTNATNSISQASRTVRVTVNDGDGGTSNSTDVTVAVVETVAPSVVSIVVDDTVLTIGETTTVTITFSEAVTGLDIADFTVANGGLSSLSSADSGITWTATLTPTAGVEGATNVITLNNTLYTDLAGNSGVGTTDSNNYAVDTLRPSATLVVADTALIAGETSLVTITFNEAVTGFANNDLTIANGTLDTVTSSDGGITWTATFTPTAGIEDPTNVITLNNTGVVDAAGNAGTGSTDSNNYAIDTSRPTATLVVTDTALVDGQTTTLTITFSEAISGLTVDDLVAGNAALSALSSSDGGITWTATLTPDAAVDEATNVVTLTNTGVTDAAGNTGLGTTSSNNYAIDSAAPSVVSVSVPADTTYVAGQTLTFTLNTSEAVTVDTTGGTPQLALTIGATSRSAAFVGGSGTSALVFSYTVQAGDFDDDGIAVGALSANSGTLKDAAGNDMTLTLNAIADTSGVLVDAVLPALVSLSPVDDATGVTPSANLVITLDEDIALGAGTIAVYDSDDVLFASIDVTSHGGQLSINGAALTIDLSANLIEDVSYYVLVDGGAITDLAGNAFAGIAGPTSWSFAVADISPPAVTAITVAGSPAASAAAIQFTVTFDEVPANISVSDFTLTPSSGAVSGSIASHSPVNLNTVTVTIDQITGTGTLRLDVNANSGITDTLGNGDGTNGYVAAFTSGDLHTVDREAPVAPVTPTLESGSDTGDSSSDGITNVAMPTITGTAEPNAVITFTSSVDGVLGTATADGSGNWSFTPSTALTEATHFITVTATDGAGNVSTSSANLTLQLDTSAPTGHSATFAETLLNAGNSTATGFAIAAGEIGATYNYTITSAGGGTPVTGTGTISSVPQVVTGLNLSGLGDGALTLSLVLTDTAGNAATAVTAGATLDTALPGGHSVSFGATDFNSGNASAVSFSFADAEVGASYSYTITSSGGGTPVTGSGTLSSANQTISGIDLSGLADGTLTLSVVVSDRAGNEAVAVTDSALLDQTAPGVTISSAANALLNSAFTASIDFTEVVTGFAVGDISVTNATLSNMVSNGGDSYSVTVTPNADGDVTLEIATGIAQDAAGNNNTAAVPLSLVYDGTAPTLTSSVPADNATTVLYNTNVTLTFSEPVSASSGNLTLFDAADNSVVEAFAVGSVTINSNVVTLDPSADLVPNRSYYLQIAATALVDAAGNAYAGINDATALNFTVSNAAPVANGDIATVAEDESADVVVLTNDTDSDSLLNAASVTVVTQPLYGTTSVNTATGVITYTPTANYNGSDSFTYTVGDVFGAVSNAATVSVTITPVNDAPVAVGDIASTAEDNPISIDVAANDTDIDAGDSVDSDSITIVNGPAHGTVEVVDGEVLYTPELDFNGSDSFTYTIQDQSGATSNVATVLINVTGVNDLPTAAADNVTVLEDGSVDIDVLANDSDVDGTIDPTTVVVLADAGHGTTSVDALSGEITYTPAANFHGTDTFTYVVEDNDGGTSNAATVTVTVTSVNDAPVANADVAVLQEDTALSINVLGNDTDIDGTLVAASVEVVGAPVNGTAQVNTATGAIVYTPGENFNGSDSFTYRVQDNEGAWSALATVTITVLAVNDEPLANPDTASTDEDTAVIIDVLLNDNDVDGVLDPASLVLTQPANGSVADNGDGTVTYTPRANFFGSDSFTYTVADDDGGVSNSATVTVTVNPVNDAPVISGTPAASVNQDSTYSFTPTASDVDPNTTLTFSITNKPVWASFNTATGALTGTPGNDDVGTYGGIVVSVSDGLLSVSLPAFAIEVINVNDPPQISGTPPPSVNQDGSYSFIPTVVDVDPGTTLTFSIINLPSWASFDPATGVFSGTPGNSDVGTYNNIVISVSDGIATTPLTSFDITVENVNDAPIPAPDAYSVEEGRLLQRDAATGLLANDVDIDGDTLTAALVTGPRNASQFTLNPDGSFSYQHNGSETVVDSFTYRVSDGAVTSEPVNVHFTIVPVNDPPTFVTTPVLATLEGTVYTYDVGVTDPDSVVSLALIEGPEWLSLTGNRLTGTAPLNELGGTTVVLRATDEQYTVDQTYNLTVVEQEASLVSITTQWLGLPSIVGSAVDLIVTLTHNKGPALSGASLAVNLRDVDVAATMANCTAGTNAFTCPVNLVAGASTSFRLRVTPAEEGNLIVNLNLTQAAESVAATITDVSVSERAVSQGDVTFNLANATALASINLLNDGVRELVAGTSLGDTVKLLNYNIASRTAQVIGEIENRGYTDRVRVADIDQDGLEDIVVVNRSGDASAVYYERGDGFAVEPGSVTLAHAREAIVRDLNGDGYPELILGANGFNLYIYENNEGVYDIPPLIFNSPASILHFALLQRLPTDAPLEGTLVITSSTAVQLVRFGLNPDGGIAKPEGDIDSGDNQQKFTLVRSLDLSGVSAVQLVDIDGDGREEIVVSTTHQRNSSEASGVTVIAVTPDEQLLTVARLGAASAKHVEVADFNGDGLPDLLVANDNNSYQFYRGTGQVADWTLTNTILYHRSTLVVPEDVNGDGLADVLVYEDGDEQVELYLSAPDGNTGETADLGLFAGIAPSPNSYRLTVNLAVNNAGDYVAENVRVILPLPDSIQVAVLPDNCTHDQDINQVNCHIDQLAPNTHADIAITLLGSYGMSQQTLVFSATSDALEENPSDNSLSVPLTGVYEYKRARIKGGGSVDYLWFGALLGLGLARRRRLSRPSIWNQAASVCLPLAALLTVAAPQVEAASPNSYLEGTVALVNSDWDMMNFYYDLAGSTQQASLTTKDDQRFGWQLLYGFRAHRNFAVEAGYLDTGQTELEVDAVTTDTTSLRQALIDNVPVAGEGPYLGVRASYFGEREQELYLKAGLWSWSAGYALTLGDQQEWVKADGTDWLLSLGFAVPVNQRFNIGGSVQTAALGDGRLVSFGLTLQYRFDVRTSEP